MLALFLLCFFAYHQKCQIDSLVDTLNLQHEAILKQRELVTHQSRYIDLLNNENINKDYPIIRRPI